MSDFPLESEEPDRLFEPSEIHEWIIGVPVLIEQRTSPFSRKPPPKEVIKEIIMLASTFFSKDVGTLSLYDIALDGRRRGVAYYTPGEWKYIYRRDRRLE